MSDENKENVPVTTNKDEAKTETSAVRPVTEMDRVSGEMERVFDRLFRGGWPVFGRWREIPMLDRLFELETPRSPNLDVIDRDNEILVRAELPGIEQKDLNISLTDNMLTIKGQSTSEAKEEKGDYHKREISSFSFSRSVTLPGAVDASNTKASLKNGMLEITLPKVESSKRRTITVQ